MRVRWSCHALPAKTLVNRVDVDFSLKKAVVLADVFERLGISATFFVRLHALHEEVTIRRVYVEHAVRFQRQPDRMKDVEPLVVMPAAGGPDAVDGREATKPIAIRQVIEIK